jgi:hypothetical protein
LSVVLGSALVGQRKDSSPKEIADSFKLRLSPLASPSTVVEFSEYNPRQVQRRGPGEPRRQGLLAAKVRDYVVSTRTLPVAFIDSLVAFLDHPIQFVGLLRR